MLKSMQHVSSIKQGEFRTSNDPKARFICVLGSCIATCFYDPVARVGGMNHFLLPGHDPGATGEVKYGANAMEQLVNALLRSGASRDRLRVSLYGGAKLIKSGGQIGANNAAFARDFVLREGFALHDADVGGTYGRRLTFLPESGAANVEILRSDAQVPSDAQTATLPRASGSIELF